MERKGSTLSKVSTKGQATIPREVREHLDVRPGDSVVFEIIDDQVVIRKARPIDMDFLRFQEHAFSEWLSEADEEAYRDL
jgi:AbrB family looped-hinge helix DNA binding protein